jgi:hypothetical protein
MRLFIRSINKAHPALLLCAVNLTLMALLFLQLHPEEELTCSEALQVSVFDLFIADRYFFFNYSSLIARIWLFLNLPALMLSSLSELLIRPITHTALTGYQLSWVRAGFITMYATVQWALIGIGLGWRRRRNSYK